MTNRFQNAINVVTADIESRSRELVASLLSLDRSTEREVAEKRMLDQLHEDRRAVIAMSAPPARSPNT